MRKEQIEALLNRLMEPLAALEHERWSHWQRYFAARASANPMVHLWFLPNLATRSEKQSATKYTELSEQERESDREQVRKYLPLIASALRKHLPRDCE